MLRRPNRKVVLVIDRLVQPASVRLKTSILISRGVIEQHVLRRLEMND